MLRVTKLESSKGNNSYTAWILSQNVTNEKTKEDSHRILRCVVTVAMLLGLLPVSSSKRLSFQWFSIQTIYSSLLIGVLSFNGYLNFQFFWVETTGITNVRFLAITFERPLRVAAAALALIFTFNLSRHASNILRQWNDTTRLSVQYQKVVNANLRQKKGTAYSLAIVTLVFLLTAIAEQILYDARLYTSQSCQNTTTFVECYGTNPYGGALLATSMSGGQLVTWIAYMVNCISKLALIFNDLIVCFMSVTLNANFHVITEFLTIATPRTRDQWKTLRHSHFKLCVLVKTVDQHLAPIILHSIAINIYGLCHQIYFSIRPSPATMSSDIDFVNTMWKIFSVAHLAIRVLAVILTAAKLAKEVKAPVQRLHHCPNSAFSNEVVHFINQICGGDTVGFTGCRFFTLTHYLLFGIISLIFTYEVILLNSKKN